MFIKQGFPQNTTFTHFSPNNVAGCISKVECNVGVNLEFIETDYRISHNRAVLPHRFYY
jgi:hypothetical protein